MKKRRGVRCASALAAGVMTCAATADYYQAVEVGYWVSATDFGGAQVDVYVVDVYLLSNDAWGGTDGSGDTLLNVYNWNTVGGPSSAFFQSFTSTGWLAQNAGGIFDSPALQQADSFVTIGGFGADGLQSPGAGTGSALDPNFGGNTAAGPGALAGWYNSSPPSLNGAVMTYDSGVTGVLVGRFSSLSGQVDLTGSTMSLTWNQGLGTTPAQGSFTVEGSTPVVPGLGGVFALAGIGLIGRRQRR